jgi:hypothetical protein
VKDYKSLADKRLQQVDWSQLGANLATFTKNLLYPGTIGNLKQMVISNLKKMISGEQC